MKEFMEGTREMAAEKELEKPTNVRGKSNPGQLRRK
jgi:hypothetical protein